jgi:hypothetical protein
MNAAMIANRRAAMYAVEEVSEAAKKACADRVWCGFVTPETMRRLIVYAMTARQCFRDARGMRSPVATLAKARREFVQT